MIACVYCGGQHQAASEVRSCWERGGDTALDRDNGDAPPSPDTSSTDRSSTDGSSIDTPSTDKLATGAVAAEPPHASFADHDARPAPPIGNQPDRIEHRSAASAAAKRGPTLRVPPAIDQRGPALLGRNAVVEPGAADPPGWEGVRRFQIDPAVLADPESTVRALRAARHSGESVIVELDPTLAGRFGPRQRPAETETAPVHTLDPGFTFWIDELHALAFTNSFDGRDADPPATTSPEVWVDRGPLRMIPPIERIPVIHAAAVVGGEAVAPTDNTTSADLAPDQLAAVIHNHGSARIIAPAGSGKTRVLTERVRHLMTRWNLPPSSICLVAFNKRAQIEMEQRTSDLGGLQVRTLNSLALAIVNGTPPFARQPQGVKTIDEIEVRRILEGFVKTPRRLNIDPLATWIDALSAVRLGLRLPHDVEADYGGDVTGLADVYDRYRAVLQRQRLVDFDHQVIAAIEVLLTQPEARSHAQSVCQVLLVDEFQDLTPAHLLLIRLLAGPLGSVFGVGDDDQTIYGYNGADPAWLIDFADWFPGAGDHPLEINYRCPAGIVEGADRLLRHNLHRVAKAIRPSPNAAAGGWSADSSPDPVAATVEWITDAIERGVASAEIAVLTRVNTVLAPVQVGLSIAGVPISGGVGTDYAERTAVRAAFAWLRLAETDSFAPRDLSEALRRPSRKLHPRVRDWASEQTDVDGLRRLAARLNTDKDTRAVEEFADDLERLRGMYRRKATTGELLRHLIDDIGLGTAVATLDGGRRGTNRAAQNDDLQAFGQLADLYDQHGSGPFEQWLRSHLSAPRSDQGVVLSTVHRVKGQEWSHVVVHLADDDQYPHRLAEDDEEERRLFHVAITRAGVQARIVSGPRPSPFVDELTTEPTPIADRLAAAAQTRRSAKRGPADAQRKRDPEAESHPLIDRTSVIAVPGLVLVDQGQEWIIDELEPSAAVGRNGSATRRFALGAKVETVGRQRGALAVRPGTLTETSVRAFDLLRSYRERVRDGKPAYVVFDDKTLAAIAEAAPTDLDELAAVRGVGPAKLETYGDDVLELIEQAAGTAST